MASSDDGAHGQYGSGGRSVIMLSGPGTSTLSYNPTKPCHTIMRKTNGRLSSNKTSSANGSHTARRTTSSSTFSSPSTRRLSRPSSSTRRAAKHQDTKATRLSNGRRGSNGRHGSGYDENESPDVGSPVSRVNLATDMVARRHRERDTLPSQPHRPCNIHGGAQP